MKITSVKTAASRMPAYLGAGQGPTWGLPARRVRAWRLQTLRSKGEERLIGRDPFTIDALFERDPAAASCSEAVSPARFYRPHRHRDRLGTSRERRSRRRSMKLLGGKFRDDIHDGYDYRGQPRDGHGGNPASGRWRARGQVP